MAKDNNQNQNHNRKPIRKFVKKAGLWCVTSWRPDGTQKIEWFAKKPEI